MSNQYVREFAQKVAENISRVIVGKEREVELLLTALLSEGHVLLEDVPGVGKTMLARALAASLGCSFKRIQCTPDLLPSDITGVTVYHQQSGEFQFKPGPIMNHIVLADEINRATPRTQSSLLESMGEGQVTADGKTYKLDPPFLVLATQNPVEYEGTFPLPEAQLDRFFIKLHLGYPDVDEENLILKRLQRKHPIDTIEACTDPATVVELQNQVREVYVEDSVRSYIVRLTQATRGGSEVLLGASPRGSLALFRAGQALAALRGRDYVLPDDIKDVAVEVLAHRVLLKSESRLKGVTAEDFVQELIRQVPLEMENQ